MTAVPDRPEPLGLDLAAAEPIPEEGIEAALAVMRSGALFRYSEVTGQPSQVAEWESDFATYLGRPYAVATSSILPIISFSSSLFEALDPTPTALAL